MFKDWSYEEVKSKADAIKELGYSEIYLTEGEKPWHLATRCARGGSRRLDINTSVWFYAVAPSGISLRWSFDIESPSANGKGTYQIDVEGCRVVIAQLINNSCRAQFRQYLRDCADIVEQQAQELGKELLRQEQTVGRLRSI